MPIITTNVSDIAEYMNSNNDGFLLDDIQDEKIINAMINIIASKKDYNKCQIDFDYRNYIQMTERWLSVLMSEGEVG